MFIIFNFTLIILTLALSMVYGTTDMCPINKQEIEIVKWPDFFFFF